MPEKAAEIEAMLRPYFRTAIEENQSIGRRYRRQDEIGTPFCLTVDGESASDGCVTLRERDSMEQQRVPIANLVEIMHGAIAAWQRPEPVASS